MVVSMTPDAQQPEQWECNVCENKCKIESKTKTYPNCGCLYNPDIGAIWSTRPHTPAPEEQEQRTISQIKRDIRRLAECDPAIKEYLAEQWDKAAHKAREDVLDAISMRLETQGVEVHERNDQRYYVVGGTFNFASFMQWLESLRAEQESKW